MILFITGAPGGGKTLSAVIRIAEQLEKNKKPGALYYDEFKNLSDEEKQRTPHRRKIYSDIDGLNFETEDIINVGESWDWREADDGSLIVLDEVHQRWPTTGKSGRAQDETIKDLDKHRHRGFDFILISQYPTKVHFEVRTNCSEHLHLLRIAGSKFATQYTWPRVVTDPNDYNTRTEADKKPFKYPKSIFKHYKSANIHTAKFKMPMMGWVLIGIFSVLISVFIWSTSKSIEARKGNEESTQTDMGAGEFAEPPDPVSESIYAGCIAAKNNCMCYDQNYHPIKMDYLKCKAIMNQPLPTVPRIAKSNNK